MATLLQLIRSKAIYINRATNDMHGSAAWMKMKQLIRLYYKQNDITEISFNEAQKLFQLRSDLNKDMLIEINANVFGK